MSRVFPPKVSFLRNFNFSICCSNFGYFSCPCLPLLRLRFRLVSFVQCNKFSLTANEGNRQPIAFLVAFPSYCCRRWLIYIYFPWARCYLLFLLSNTSTGQYVCRQSHLHAISCLYFVPTICVCLPISFLYFQSSLVFFTLRTKLNRNKSLKGQENRKGLALKCFVLELIPNPEQLSLMLIHVIIWLRIRGQHINH